MSIAASLLMVNLNVHSVSAATNAMGNVNWPGSFWAAQYPYVDDRIDIVDLDLVARALGTTPMWPYWGWTWYWEDPPGRYVAVWNVDADFNGDNVINIWDFYRASINYGAIGD